MSEDGNPSQIADVLSSRVRDLISDVLRDVSGGGIVDGFVLMATFIDGDGEPSFTFSVAPEQRMVTTTGLIECTRLLHTRQVERFFDGDDDE